MSDGIYQVRGYDMANLTVVKGDTGWIVFDTLMSVECSQAAMQLIEKNLGHFPVKAVVISHSHVDHFGGIAGVMAAEDKADETLSIEKQLASGKIPVIAPAGFTEHAVKENVYAGKGMGRRSNYQYGILLKPGVTGKLAQGIGMGQSIGTISFMTPSYEIKESGERLTIDGVELEFQLTPGTEAPAEMNTWLPQYKALWMAENCTGTLHNLYTLRGAEVRDGAAWASYITEAISLYGKDAEVTFQSHNWPHWGNNVVNDYMVNTAAVYKYINDQTLTYINQGYTSDEISNMIAVSESTPGPMGVNMATYVGFHIKGILGGLAAPLSLVLPSVIIIILVSRALDKFRDSPLVKNGFYGLRPASAGLIFGAMLEVFAASLLHTENWSGIASLGSVINLSLIHISEPTRP